MIILEDGEKRLKYIDSEEKIERILIPIIECEIGIVKPWTLMQHIDNAYEFTIYHSRVQAETIRVDNDFEVLRFGYVDLKRTEALRRALAKEYGEQYLSDLHEFLIAKADEEIKELKGLVYSNQTENT